MGLNRGGGELEQMNLKKGPSQSGVLAPLGADVLLGAGTPLAKLLLNSVSSWLMADWSILPWFRLRAG
jgi:hypothetical protein